MTRKHFEMIARRLKENRDRTNDKASADILAHEIAEDLAGLNSLFDRTRFLLACGWSELDSTAWYDEDGNFRPDWEAFDRENVCEDGS